MDIVGKLERSRRMRLVKSHGNRTTEHRLIHLFSDLKIRGWRRRSTLPGSPDFVFPKLKLVVFVDGCFWHGCPQHYTRPSSNVAFWVRKYHDNIARDRRVDAQIRRLGWRVLRIWEHELRSKQLPELKRRLGRYVFSE